MDEIRAAIQSGDKQLMTKIRSWLKKPERPSENDSSERQPSLDRAASNDPRQQQTVEGSEPSLILQPASSSKKVSPRRRKSISPQRIPSVTKSRVRDDELYKKKTAALEKARAVKRAKYDER